MAKAPKDSAIDRRPLHAPDFYGTAELLKTRIGALLVGLKTASRPSRKHRVLSPP